MKKITLKPSTTVKEVTDFFSKNFPNESLVELSTLKGNLAGPDRRLRALTEKDLTGGIEVEVKKTIEEAISYLEEVTGLCKYNNEITLQINSKPMKNIYVFDEKVVSLEAKYTKTIDKNIKNFTKKWPKFKDNIKFDGDKLLFIISNNYQIYEHNNIVDFLESNVGYGRTFNDCGEALNKDFYKDLYNLFSNDEGNVMFSSGDYDCLMKTVGKFDSSHYFEVKSDGLHWRFDEAHEDDEQYEDDEAYKDYDET